MSRKKIYSYDSKGNLIGIEERDHIDDERDGKGCCGLIVLIFILMALAQAC